MDDLELKLKELQVENERLELKYKELLIKDIKISTRRKKILLMLDRLELWRITKLKRELDDFEEEERERLEKERDRLHI
ncbi:MAG: hypothetical protein ACFE9S_18430 [Candidatus Hermodarchaeota archaeon]